VAESGKQLAVGFNRRFAPFYLEQKQALSKRNGPAVIQCRVHSPGISGSYWMADPSIGGAIMGEAVHFIDLMYWLLESEPVVVSAFSLPTESKAYIGENNVVASFRFADGSIGNLTYTTVGSQKSAGELVEVFASGTTAVTQDFKKLRLQTQGSKSMNKWWPEKGYKTQLETFFTAIRNGAAPIATVRDGSRATLACLRMLESAKTGQPCAIDLQSLLEQCAEPNV
jgi:predicted dehydrogenase